MNKKILVSGCALMDLSLNVCRLPNPGETVTDDGGVAYTPGGNAIGVAMAFAKQGAQTALCAKLGADSHGEILYKFCRDGGIDCSGISVERDQPTGFCVTAKEKNGQNRSILYPGASARLTTENLMRAFSAQQDALVTDLELPAQTVVNAAKIAASKGMSIFVDAAPGDKSFPLEALPPCEVFSPNEAETLAFTGIIPQGADASLRAALALWRRVKCRYIVIKQGARGACIYDGKHFDMVSAVRVDRTAEINAAGDAFTAAMVLEYLRGGDIKSAVKYATVAAAVAVARQGSVSSLPTEEEIRNNIR